MLVWQGSSHYEAGWFGQFISNQDILILINLTFSSGDTVNLNGLFVRFTVGIQIPVLSRFQMIETCQIVSYKAMSQKLDLSVSGIWTVHLVMWHIRPFKNWSTKSPFFKCSAFRSPLWVLKTWNSDDIKEMFYTITFQPQCTTTLQEEVDSMKSGQSIVSGRI